MMRFFTGALVLTLAGAVCAQTDIRDAPGGKRLLFVDNDDIRPEPGGKRLLFVDGQDIRDEPGGKRLMFVDGDDVRPEPGSYRIAFYDGEQLRRRPGGQVLLSLKHPDIRPDFNGERLFFIDGKELSRAQMTAVLMQIKPEVFKLSDDEIAALKKEMADNAAESERQASEDKIPGTYDIASYWSPAGDKRSGKVEVVKKGDYYVATTAFGQDGVLVRIDDENTALALGPTGTAALGIFAIKGGELSGKWVPTYAPGTDAANIGTETASGSPDLKGDYKVTGKQPKTQADYAGTLTITPDEETTLEGDGKCYTLTWTFGATKIQGVGFRYKDTLYVSAASAPDFSILRLKTKDGLVGDWYNNAKAKGSYTMIK